MIRRPAGAFGHHPAGGRRAPLHPQVRRGLGRRGRGGELGAPRHYNRVEAAYGDMAPTILRIGMAYDALEQAYRRMVFNVLAVNQDDHVKNLSFHMDGAGTWSLTPAYDVTFGRGHGWTANHQMRVRDKVSGIREADLLAVAGEFGIKKPERILEQTGSAIADWVGFARAYGVPAGVARAIRGELDAGAETVAG